MIRSYIRRMRVSNQPNGLLKKPSRLKSALRVESQAIDNQCGAHACGLANVRGLFQKPVCSRMNLRAEGNPMRSALVILLAMVPLGAQSPTGFPPVLRIFREDVKEGKAAAHEKTEAAFMQAAAKAKYPAHILGMASMTGTSQALFLEGHDNIASIADSQDVMDTAEFGAIDAADAQVRINQRSMLAV